MCRVVHRDIEKEDIYIGPGSRWGNPFEVGRDGSRRVVMLKFKDYLWDQIKEDLITKKMLVGLNGKKLGCFCHPKHCHGDEIVPFVKWAVNMEYLLKEKSELFE